MGIPRLTTHLEPFQIPTTLGCTNRDCPNHAPRSPHSAIIDGPGLAYSIFYKLLGRNDAKTALAAHPSYHELSAAVLAVLRLFERCGFNVKHIYFDGALPEAKRPTRVHRLLDTLGRLSTYRTVHAAGFKVASLKPLDFEQRAEELLYPWSVPAFARNLPASPFLVPAVFEALKESEFTGRTQLVPGEADPYLAAATRVSEGHLCLTGDSDLAIYDLGDAALGFFSSLEAQACSECRDGTALRAKALRQRDLIVKIGESAGAKDLIDLGYELQEDNHVAFEEAVRRVSKKTSKAHKARAIGHVTNLNAFAADYEQDVDLNAMKDAPEWRQRLDNRTSEMVVQTFSRSKAMPHSYLLPLIEDSERASAWTPSRAMRALAYSVMVIISEAQTHGVIEYGRSGRRIVDSNINVLAQANINHQLDAMHKQFGVIEQQLGLQSPAFAQIIHTVMYVYQWHLEEEKTPPDVKLIASALGNHQTAKLSWQSIHLKAQIHGALYSMRTLNQMLLAAEAVASNDFLQTNFKAQVLPLQEVILTDSELAATGLAKHAEWIVQNSLKEYTNDLGHDTKGPEQDSDANAQSEHQHLSDSWDTVGSKGGKKRKRTRVRISKSVPKGSLTSSNTNPFEPLR